MKKFKKVIALLCVLTLVLGLAACGSNGSSSSSAGNADSTASPADSSASDSAADGQKDSGNTDTTAAGETGKNIKVSSSGNADGSIILTFVTGGGAEEDTMKVYPDTKLDLSEMVPPSMAGCEFTGWYLDKYLSTPYEEDMTFSKDTTLYAGYRSNGTTFASYQADMPADTEFVLYSTEKITAETLAEYIKFEDVYNGKISISMKDIESNPDIPEDTDSELTEELKQEGIDFTKTVTAGSFRYRLYAEGGFAAGQLYSLTILKPETERFESAGSISLIGNDAVQLNFKIKEEKMDTQVAKAGIINVASKDVQEIKKTGDNEYTAVLSSTAPVKEGDVIYLPDGGEEGKGVHYKVLTVGESSGQGRPCTMEIASTSDLWDEYAYSFDSGDLENYSVEFDENVQDELAKEIGTSIGFAAYVDAVMDGVKESPEIQEQLQYVSKENYDRFMEMTAVDLGIGPEELQDVNTLSISGEKYGEINFDIGLSEQKIPYVGIEFESKEFEWDFGKNEKTGLQGTVKLKFHISESCPVSVYGKTIAKNAKYASMKDDFVMVGIVPDSTTEFSFNATLELGKEEKDDDESGTDSSSSGTSSNSTSSGSSSNGSTNSGSSSNGSTNSGSSSHSTNSGSSSNGSTNSGTSSHSTNSGSSSNGSTNSGTSSHSTNSGSSSNGSTNSGTSSHSTSSGSSSNSTSSGSTNSSALGGVGGGAGAAGNETVAENSKDDSSKKLESELGIDIDTSEDSEVVISVAKQTRDLWKYVDQMHSLMADNNELYDVDLNYVDLVDKELGKINLTFSGVDSVQITFGITFSIAAQVSLTAKISYEHKGDYYISNGKCIYDKGIIKDIETYGSSSSLSSFKTGARTLSSDLNVGVVLQGGIGVKFGIKLGLNLSGFQMNDLLHVGLEAGAGPYGELTGYFAYNFNKSSGQYFTDMLNKEGEEYESSVSTFAGGARVSVGIFVELKATIKIVKEWEIGLADWKFPLWQQELGAFSSSAEDIYGGFVDSTETIALSSNLVDLTDMKDKNGNTVKLENKIRSTDSDAPYKLETDIGDKNSSCLKVLRGNMKTSSVAYSDDDKVSAVTFNREDYDFEIAEITLADSKISNVRGLDGGLRKQSITYSKPEEIAKYAVALNGVLDGGYVVVRNGALSQDMTIKVVAKASKVQDVFTAENPTKTFYINYSATGNTKTQYHINFYDTDGNLLTQDTYPAGATPVAFAKPGYQCEGDVKIWLSVALELGDGNYREEAEKVRAAKYYKGWDTTIKDYWGYSPSDWDVNTAFWSDVPMSSGKGGKVMTAEDIGVMKEDVNVYLHMNPAKDMKASWVLNWSDSPQTIKTVTYQYGTENQLEKQNPDLVSYSRLNDGTEIGTKESFTDWTKTEDVNATSKATITVIHDDEYVEGERYYYHQTKDSHEVTRRKMQPDLVYATAAPVLKNVWKNVYFVYNGKKVAARTNIGEVPAVPEEFRLDSIMGWSRAVQYAVSENVSYSNVKNETSFYKELPALTEQDQTITYYGLDRSGTEINVFCRAVTQDSDGKYKAFGHVDDNRIGMTYDGLQDFLKGVALPDADMLLVTDTSKTAAERAAVYSFAGWKIPTREDFEYGTVTADYADLASISQKGSKVLLDEGESYPLLAVYTASPVNKLFFNAKGAGTIDNSSNGTSQQSWTGANVYTLSENNTKLEVDYASSDTVNKANRSLSFFPPKIIAADRDRSSLAFDNYYWKSTEKIGGDYITLKNGSYADLDGLAAAGGGSITFEPVFEERGVIITLKDSAEAFKLGEDLSFTIYGKVGEKLTAADIFSYIHERPGYVSYKHGEDHFADVIAIPDEAPLTYTFGSGDTENGILLVDSIEINWKGKSASILDLNGGRLADGSVKKTLTGNPEDTIDLSYYQPVTPNYVTDAEGYQVEYAFDGWKSSKTDTIVTSIHYGENATAQWKATGKKYRFISITLQANGGTFSNRTGSLTIDRFNVDAQLSAQYDYETPTPPPGYTFSHWAWSNNTGDFVSIYTEGKVIEAGYKAGNYLTAVYDEIPSVSVSATSYSGAYDGSPHGISVSVSPSYATKEYSTDQKTWSETAPTCTNVADGKKTVYVRATAAGYPQSGTAAATIEITKKEVIVKADDKSKVFNEVSTATDPAWTSTVTGLVGSDSITGIVYSREKGETVGTYAITPSGGTVGDNYSITYRNGTFTIKPGNTVTYTIESINGKYRETSRSKFYLNYQTSVLINGTSDGGSFVDPYSIDVIVASDGKLPAQSVTMVTENKVSNGEPTVGTVPPNNVTYTVNGKDYTAETIKDVSYNSAITFVTVKIATVAIVFKDGDSTDGYSLNYSGTMVTDTDPGYTLMKGQTLDICDNDYFIGLYQGTDYAPEKVVSYDYIRYYIDDSTTGLSKTNLLSHVFNKDATVYVKYYSGNHASSGEASQNTGSSTRSFLAAPVLMSAAPAPTADTGTVSEVPAEEVSENAADAQAAGIAASPAVVPAEEQGETVQETAAETLPAEVPAAEVPSEEATAAETSTADTPAAEAPAAETPSSGASEEKKEESSEQPVEELTLPPAAEGTDKTEAGT